MNFKIIALNSVWMKWFGGVEPALTKLQQEYKGVTGIKYDEFWGKWIVKVAPIGSESRRKWGPK
jgi:hypothetical protein